MKRYKKVLEIEVLKKYYDLQSNNYAVGNWLDYIPIRMMANVLETSKYQIRKAYKSLTEQGYMKLEYFPVYWEEYYNGLYDEAIPVLFTKCYVLTCKGKELLKSRRQI